MMALEASKIILGKVLNLHASNEEIKNGLFPLPPQNKFYEAVMEIRKQIGDEPDDNILREMNFSIVAAAVRVVSIWDSNGTDWLQKPKEYSFD